MAIKVVVVRRIDVTATEAEVVGKAGSRVGPRGPVITVQASIDKLTSAAGIDTPAPHKEQWT